MNDETGINYVMTQGNPGEGYKIIKTGYNNWPKGHYVI